MTARPPISETVTWVYTEDLAGTSAFYAETLGLEVTRDEGVARIYRTSKDGYVGVCETVGNRVVEPNGGMITLVTDDVDGWYAHLSATGATLRSRPERNDQFGIYAFLAEDPNGYLIEFQQFLDGND